MAEEKKPAVRLERPYPSSFRLSAEDIAMLKQLADTLQLSKSDVIHLALRDYAQKHLRAKAAG